MSLDLSRIDSFNGSSTALEYASNVNDAIARLNAEDTDRSSGVVVVTRRTDTDSDGASLPTTKIGPDTAAPVAPVAAADPAETSPGDVTAVVLTNDLQGETNNAAVIKITDNGSGSGSTISIQVMDDSQPDGISTVIINTDQLENNSQIVYGNIAKDTDTNAPRSLFLIVPSEATGSENDTFLYSSVKAVESIDPATAFSNDGFTTFSGRDNFQNYGGAVSLQVDGKQFIVWLDTDQSVEENFTGDVDARTGVFDSSSEASLSTVSNGFQVVNLVFENGALRQVTQDGTAYANFNAYAQKLIQDAAPSAPVNGEIADRQNNFITGNARRFVTELFNRTYAVTSAINQSGYDDIMNRADLTRKYTIEYLNSRV
jgi:hypothetical protein